MGHALRRRRIDVPLPLLFVETMGENELEGFLLTETVEGAVTLSAALEQHLPKMKPNERQSWITQYADLLAKRIRKLHSWKFEHGCLNTEAILVANDHNRCRVWFQKLDSVRKRSYLPRLSIVATLGTLNKGTLSATAIRNTHRVRFLKRYLGDTFSHEWKHLWRDVQRQMQTIETSTRGSDADGGPHSTNIAGSFQRENSKRNERKAG